MEVTDKVASYLRDFMVTLVTSSLPTLILASGANKFTPPTDTSGVVSVTDDNRVGDANPPQSTLAPRTCEAVRGGALTHSGKMAMEVVTSHEGMKPAKAMPSSFRFAVATSDGDYSGNSNIREPTPTASQVIDSGSSTALLSATEKAVIAVGSALTLTGCDAKEPILVLAVPLLLYGVCFAFAQSYVTMKALVVDSPACRRLTNKFLSSDSISGARAAMNELVSYSIKGPRWYRWLALEKHWSRAWLKWLCVAQALDNIEWAESGISLEDLKPVFIRLSDSQNIPKRILKRVGLPELKPPRS